MTARRLHTAVLTYVLAVCVLVTPAMAKSRVDLASTLRASTRQVVLYANEAPFEEILGYCSAFSINDAKDYFLTAAHCVKGADYLTVGGNKAFPIYVNTNADLAVVVVPDSGTVPALKLASSVEQGQEVFNYGYGEAWTSPMFRAGYISIVDVAPFDKAVPEILVGLNEHFTVLDFAIIPGQSGGPIVNEAGEVITVNQLGDGVIGMGRTLTEIYANVGKYFGG